jgi:FlaG/FlaF family flagellin (archaellin)
MWKLSASLLIAIALVLAAPSQSALAGGKSTANGQHFPDALITTRTTSNGNGVKAATSAKITHRKAGKGQY